MRRCACLAGLAFVIGLVASRPAAAQQFRKFQQAPAAPAVPAQNNANNAQGPFNIPGGQTPIGFNVSQMNGGGLNGGTPLASMLANGGAAGLGGFNTQFNSTTLGPTSNPFASVPYAGFNTNWMNQMYGNPYTSAGAGNAYLSSAFANPYQTPGYGNPYYNPYYFMGTGYPTGNYNSLYPPISPTGMYNYNLNYQYLTNPYINPLSNPAFSGPFQPSVFNSLAPLNAMGFGNLLQQMPLPNGMPGQQGQQQNNPAFP